MSDFPAMLTVPLGLMAGWLAGLFVTHWLFLLLSAIGKPAVADEPGTARNRAGAIAFTILHPVPWLLLALPYGVWRAASERPGETWLWFFGSAVLALVGMFALGFLVARKSRARVTHAASNDR